MLVLVSHGSFCSLLAKQHCRSSRYWTSGGGRHPVGAGNYVTLCDLDIFVDQAAQPVAAQNAQNAHFGSWMGAPGGRFLLQRPSSNARQVCPGRLGAGSKAGVFEDLPRR